jgi:hypothetical protein
MSLASAMPALGPAQHTTGHTPSWVIAASIAAIVLVLVAIVVVVLVVTWISGPNDSDDSDDGGEDGGGGGPHAPDQPPPEPSWWSGPPEPSWWPEFERQFRKHVAIGSLSRSSLSGDERDP